MTLYSYFHQGGILMWPILVASILALTVSLERLWSLRYTALLPKALMDKIEVMVAKEEYTEGLALCVNNESPLARVLTIALQNRGKARSIIKELLEEAGRREAAYLERLLPVLTVVIAISPLLGLMGTVLGMIELFQGLDLSGGGDMSPVAEGIAKALFTTFSGLSVAVPTLIVHRYLLSRVDHSLTVMEDISLRILEMVKAPEVR